MSVDYAWTCLKRTQLATVLSVSSLPLSVMVRSCHACINLSGLHSSGFTPTLRSGSSPSPTRQQAGILHAQNFLRTFGLHEIFKSVHLKFYGIWQQTDIHTHNFCICSHASVGLTQARPNYLLYLANTEPLCFGPYTGWYSYISAGCHVVFCINV